MCEKFQVSATFDSNRCKYPCNLCMCDAENLNNVNLTFEPRTVQKMREIVDQIERAPTSTTKKLISQQWSVHPVQVCIDNLIFLYNILFRNNI
jgi:hypothetical protein